MFRNIVVALSGGVDSAVTALLLKQKGYNVTAVFMQNWDIPDEKGMCSVENDYNDAKWVSERLNIPLVRVNFVKEYWNSVFSDILDKYQNGHTPNPDILCNKYIKFDKFFHLALNKFNADAIATGHYARSSFGPFLEQFQPDKNVKLLKACDESKDQTLFLCQISQESLRRTMFPLGEFLKSNVKEIAKNAGLDFLANKKESMGICFIGKRHFQHFIQQYIENKTGYCIDLENGEVLDKHDGIHNYTIGQRFVVRDKPHPYYLCSKNIETNQLCLVKKDTNHPALFSDFVLTTKPHWIEEEPVELKANDRVLKCDFRFQHRNPVIPCKIYKLTEGGLIVQLSTPLRALTKGQFCVFYKGKECLGSAQISYPGPSYFMLDQTVTTYVLSYQQREQLLAKTNKVKAART